VWAVANGEIYNHAELWRAGDEPSPVDTAVLPGLVRREGEAGLRRVRGPLAAAFVDGRDGSLQLFRDARGKRPLFILSNRQGTFAASELKALVAGAGDIPFSPHALRRFMERGFLDDDEPLLEGVKSITPGALITVRAGVITVHPPPASPTSPSTLEELTEVLRSSVMVRARTEVPAAVLLSGGLDSTLVAALSGIPLAYTMRVPVADETEKARIAAQAFGLELRIVDVNPPTLPKLCRTLWHLESPDARLGWGVADALFQLNQRLRADGIRVTLSGEGADELFLGYPWHQAQAAVERGDDVAPFLPGIGSADAAYARALMGLNTSCALDVWLRAMEGAVMTEVHRRATHVLRPELRPPKEKSGLPGPPTSARQRQRDSLERDLVAGPVRFADRLALGAGVEPRMPFLDEAVVQVALRLPVQLLETRGLDKPALRQVTRTLLGDAWQPPPKQGFRAWPTPPMEEVRTFARQLLNGHPTVVDPVFLKNAGHAPADEHLLWRAVLLELCARQLASADGPWVPL